MRRCRDRQRLSPRECRARVWTSPRARAPLQVRKIGASAGVKFGATCADTCLPRRSPAAGPRIARLCAYDAKGTALERRHLPPPLEARALRVKYAGVRRGDTNVVYSTARREASRDDVDRAARAAGGAASAAALSAHSLPRRARAALGVAPRDRSASAGALRGRWRRGGCEPSLLTFALGRRTGPTRGQAAGVSLSNDARR